MKNKSISTFLRQWRWTLCSAVVLLLSVILLFLFPRKEYLAVSTAFAILFWLSVAYRMHSACCAKQGKPAAEKTDQKE